MSGVRRAVCRGACAPGGQSRLTGVCWRLMAVALRPTPGEASFVLLELSGQKDFLFVSSVDVRP